MGHVLLGAAALARHERGACAVKALSLLAACAVFLLARAAAAGRRRQIAGEPKLEADMIWKPSPKAIQAAADAYISDKGIKAVLEAAINVDKPIVDLRAIHTGRSRQPAIAEQSRFV